MMFPAPDNLAFGFGSEPLRVLHVTNVETENYYLNNLADYTDRNAVEHLAVTLGKSGSFVESLERRGVKSFTLDCLPRNRYPEAARRLRRIVQAEQIDIVHAHLFEPTLVAAVVAKMLKRGLIVTRHHSDAIYRIEQPLKRKAFLAMECRINRVADHLVAPSQMVRDILLNRQCVPAAKVSLIPYGQTMARYNAVTPQQIAAVRQELGMPGKLAIACVSRLHREKGHSYLLAAFAQLVGNGMDAVLYLAGEGVLRERLEQEAIASGLSQRVRFLGWRNDALAVMAAADLIVHPSLQEALPSAVIEALMLGKPLIVTEISGARDAVGADEYGIIVPPANAEALHAAVTRMAGDLQAARARAAHGREYLLTYMDAGRVARAYTVCYQQVAEQRGMLRRFAREAV